MFEVRKDDKIKKQNAEKQGVGERGRHTRRLERIQNGDAGSSFVAEQQKC